MRASLRSRLFYSFFLVMVIALAVPGIWTRLVLRERILTEARARALAEAGVARQLEKLTVHKFLHVPGKLVNIVAK